jgi:hypothetical protein
MGRWRLPLALALPLSTLRWHRSSLSKAVEQSSLSAHWGCAGFAVVQ